MANTFKVSVVTPDGEALQTNAVSVIFPMHDGSKGVLAGHAPMLCRLGAGKLTVRGDETTSLFITGGFAQVTPTAVTLLCDRAVPLAQLKRADADAELAAANKLPNKTDGEHQLRNNAIDAARAKRRLAAS